MAESVPPEEAFRRLKEGNRRYVSGKPIRPNQSALRREGLLKGERPFAALLSCSDSRIPPEIIFDCGFGDLFVVRTAGNTCNDATIAALEYAVKQLGIRFIIVMGHSDCGLVKAALAEEAQPGKISSIIEQIRPAVDKVKDLPGDTVSKATGENIRMTVAKLSSCEPVLSEKVKSQELMIIGAYCTINNAAVSFI